MHILHKSILALCLIAPLAVSATERPQSVPDADQRAGENLTERLDRTRSVIKPPAVDGGILVKPPADIAKTPVIKPGDVPPQQVSPDK